MKELEKGLEKSFKPLKELKNYAHAEVDPRKQGLKQAELVAETIKDMSTQRSIQENKD